MLSIVIAIQVVFFIALISIYIQQWKQIRRLRDRFAKALGGQDSSADLETTLVTYFDTLNATKDQLDHMRAQYKHLNTIGAQSFQKFGLIRFNPFRDTGGDQSFALCLLDSNNSGVILTAVHGREGTRIYAKSIEYGQAQGALSSEEKRALSSAKRSNSVKT